MKKSVHTAIGEFNSRVLFCPVSRILSLLLWLLIAIAIIQTPLMSQVDEDPAPAGEAPLTSQQGEQSGEYEEDNEELKKLLEYIIILQEYSPKTLEKEFVRKDFQKRLLKGIVDSLAIVSNHMESTFDTLNHYQTLISNEFRQRNAGYYRLNFGFQPSYYSEMTKVRNVQDGFYFKKNLNYLYQIEEMIENHSDLLIVAFGKSQIYPLIYKSKFLISTILFFESHNAYLLQALDRYEFLLGKNEFNQDFIPNQVLRNKIYMNILDIYDRLLISVYTYNTDYRMMQIYSREKLSYLWKIVDMNHDNQQIKDAKYRRLYRVYAPIMDPNSPNYLNLYSKYRRENDVFPSLELVEDQEEQTQTQQEQQPVDADEVGNEAPSDQSTETPAQDENNPEGNQ